MGYVGRRVKRSPFVIGLTLGFWAVMLGVGLAMLVLTLIHMADLA